MPDLIVVARDANCRGVAPTRQDVVDRMGAYGSFTVCAIPDPHVERWLLLDSAAFKSVLGRGCEAPDQKCEKGRYKALLSKAVSDAGLVPLIGGLEHTEDLVEAMNLDRVAALDRSIDAFLVELQRHFRRWVDAEHT